MEVPKSQDRKLLIAVYEFVATALLSYAILISGGSSVGVTFVVFILILAANPISGAHLNPAITIALYISRKEYRKFCPLFFTMVASECLGAMAGMYLALC